MKQSIALRYGLIIAGLIIAISGVITTSVLLSVKQSSESFTDLSESIITENLTHEATLHTGQLSLQLASSLANPLYFYDIDKIGQLLEVASAQDNITQILVVDTNYTLVRDSRDPLQHLGQKIDLKLPETMAAADGVRYRLDDEYLHVITPILVNKEVTGYLYITMSLQYFLDTIAYQKQELQTLAVKHQRQLIIRATLVALLLLAFGLLAAIFIARNLAKPIDALAEFARALGRRDFGARIDIKRKDEFEELALRLNAMAKETQQHNSQLEYYANHDHLTGLLDRRSFKVKVTELITNPKVEQFAILMIDIDDFKLVNSLHGQNVGDMLIVAVAKKIELYLEHYPEAQSKLHFNLARLSGDKFIFSLQTNNIKPASQIIAHNLVKLIREPINIHGLTLNLTASVGVAVSTLQGNNADRLINNANAAMEKVKQQTKNNFHVYSDKDHLLAKRNSALITDFAHALANDELELWFQPQYSASTSKMFGVEALLRWNHPQLGMILPGTFLALIERHELIHKLGIWTLEGSLQMLKTLHTVAPHMHLSMNISPEQLFRDELISRLESYLSRHPSISNKLTIEVTETTWTSNYRDAQPILSRIKALGVNISLDDFATGHSSLSLLKEFPIDEIKLDQTFVRNLHNNPQNLALSQAIIAIADAFKLDVIAEGIETTLELDKVMALGCHKFQGFLFNRPMPESQLLEILDHTPLLLQQAKVRLQTKRF